MMTIFTRDAKLKFSKDFAISLLLLHRSQAKPPQKKNERWKIFIV